MICLLYYRLGKIPARVFTEGDFRSRVYPLPASSSLRMAYTGHTDRLHSPDPDNLYCVTYLLVYTAASASVICLFKTFQADCRYKVLHPEHILAGCIINHCPICKCQEFTVRMHLTYLHKVFPPYGWFSPGVDVHISSEFFSLPDDRINIFQTQIKLMSILRRPAIRYSLNYRLSSDPAGSPMEYYSYIFQNTHPVWRCLSGLHW